MQDSSHIPDCHTGPGLVDLQVNGTAGFDFNSSPAGWTGEAFHRVRHALQRRGILVALPTLITGDADAMIARARRYRQIIEEDPRLEASFPKLHIEGPFIAPDDGPRGAHPRQYCRTPLELPDFLNRLLEASGGRIAILTLAPELPGAMELIADAANRGVCPALGHTQATCAQIAAAVDAGARMATHLGNGSHMTLPRLDNYVQAQLADDRLWGCFIGDGHHMPFTTLKNFIRAKTMERSILVSDATAASDMGPGRYVLAGMEVEVSPSLRVSKPGEPNLAGSALTLDRAVLHVARHCMVSFEEAWAMASANPARAIGLAAPAEVSVAISLQGFQQISSE